MIKKENKLIEPKVYALLLEYPESSFLSIQPAYSLEDAFVLAKLEYEELRLGNLELRMEERKALPKLSLFTARTLKELSSVPDLLGLQKSLKKSEDNLIRRQKLFEVESQVATPKVNENKKEMSENNILMKKIIDNKDKNLFVQNKKKFSVAEIKYIQEHLK